MKKTFTRIITIAFLATLGCAASAADTKIGIVDLQKIMEKSAQYKKIRTDLTQKFDARRNQLVALRDATKADMDKLGRDSAVLSDSDKVALESKIMKERRNLESKGQDFTQDFKLAERTALKGFYDKVEAAIGSVAKEDKYDIILRRDAATYSSNTIDISDKVLKKLD